MSHKLSSYLGLTVGILLLLQSCASIQPPSGGPEDEEAPKLVSVKPAINATQLNPEEKIVFTFDEKVEAKALYQNLLISPYTDVDYKFEANKKKLIFRFQDQLDSNTTYTLNFRNGVTDITAKNPAKNLFYAFSTGKEIDSLIYGGKIEYYLDGKPGDDMVVGLYQISDTLDITEDIPDYLTISDKDGYFLLHNIKEGKYKLFAFGDKNKNNLYTKYTETYAFSSDTIYIDKNIIDARLISNDEEIEPVSLKKVKNYSGVGIVSFNNDLIQHTAINKLTQDTLFSYFDDKEDELFIYHYSEDSIKIQLQVIDTLKTQLDTTLTFFTKKKKEYKYEPFKISLEPKSYLDTKRDTIQINVATSFPIKSFTPEGFKLTKDTVNSYQPDSIIISKDRMKLSMQYFMTDYDTVKFSIDSGSIVSYGLDTIALKQKTYTPLIEQRFGTLSGKVQTRYKSYYLVLTKNDKEVKRLYSPKEFKINYLESGKYKIRVFIDEDNDKVYELSNLQKNQQAEKVYNYPNLIEIKANWEISIPDIKF